MFGPVLPEQSIVLLLGLVFSVIAPFVLLAALVFFMMSLMVDTYNWVWVFRRPYDGAGKLWKQVCMLLVMTGHNECLARTWACEWRTSQ